MAFPTTSVLDDFNRAGPGLGANWASPAWNDAGTSAIAASTLLSASATDSAALYTASGFGPDMEAFIDYSTLMGAGAASWAVGIFSSTSTTPNGYIVRYTVSGTTLNMRRVDAGASSSIKAATVQTVSAGDSVGLARRGTTIEMWYKAAAGAWTLLDSVVDATYTPSGWFSGVELSAGSTNAGRWDNFGGGTIVAAARIPILAIAPYIPASAGSSTLRS